MSLLHVLMMIGVIVVLTFGVPAMLWLLRQIRPQTPEREESERLLDERRRDARYFWR